MCVGVYVKKSVGVYQFNFVLDNPLANETKNLSGVTS
jgi:hypothetical protein